MHFELIDFKQEKVCNIITNHLLYTKFHQSMRSIHFSFKKNVLIRCVRSQEYHKQRDYLKNGCPWIAPIQGERTHEQLIEIGNMILDLMDSLVLLFPLQKRMCMNRSLCNTKANASWDWGNL